MLYLLSYLGLVRKYDVFYQIKHIRTWWTASLNSETNLAGNLGIYITIFGAILSLIVRGSNIRETP